MVNDLEIVKAEDYLRITFSGPFSSAAVRASVDALVAACKRERCEKVLFDCRPMTGEMTVRNRFEAAEYGELAIPPSLKIAMLGHEDQILPDKFFQTVARNRGVNLTLFHHTEKAIEWLRETSV